MDALVYILCTATAVSCGLLLLRGYRHSHARLLLWSGLFFLLLSVENALLLSDKILFPSIDLSLWRPPVGLVAVMVLLFGMIWEDR